MTNKRRFSRRFGCRVAFKAGSGSRCDPVNVGLFGTNADASGEMVSLDLDQWGLDLAANFDGIGTTSMKMAAPWRVYG